MSLSDPRIVYGIHSISPRSRSTGLPYGTLKVIGSANLTLNSDIEQLYAGSNKFAWAAESKTVSSELTAKVKAYPGFLFELFLGATVTDAGSDTAGTISTLTNKNGSSMVAATGLASVTVLTASKANLKFGKYVIKATGATGFTIYALSDIDFARGTAAVFTDDTLAVATVSGVSTGANSDVAALGLRFTGGASATAFTTGDTATFEVLPPSSKSSNIVVGAAAATFPAFSALLLAQKRATGEMFEIDAHNCVGGGLPINMEENAFSQPELKMTCLYDSTLDRVFTIRTIYPS
jgi:hypothetical protein